MTVRSQQRRYDGCHAFARGTGLATVLIATVVLAGWTLDPDLLRSVVPNGATMKPLTALSFVLAGLSLLLLNREGWARSGESIVRRRAAAQVASVLVILIGTIVLGEYATGLDFGVDDLMFRTALRATDDAHAGRMALATAFGLVLFGSAVFSLSRRRIGRRSLDSFLGVAVVAIGGTGMLGYLFDAPALYKMFTPAAMSLHASLLLAALGLGVLFSSPDSGLMAVVTSDGSGGIMARRLLPLVIALPVGIGWLRWHGELAGWYGTSFGLALFVAANVAVLAAIVWTNARRLNRLDDDRRSADAARRENEMRLSGVIVSAMDGIISIDEGQSIVMMNPAAERMFGCPAGEMLGSPLDRLLPERFRAAHREHIRAFARTHTTRRKMGDLGSIYGVRADGVEFPIEASISQVEVSGRKLFTVILRDVTERRRAEEELHRSKAQLTTALEAGGMGTWVHDVEAHQIAMDDAALALWGLTREQLAAGSAVLDTAIHPADLARVQEESKSFIASGTSLVNEFRVVHPDGTEHWISSRARVERDAAGRPLRTTGILMDITDRKRAAEAQLRSQKLEALGTLAGGIAHDFNNILLAINGNARLALEEAALAASTRELVREISKAGARGTALVRRILAFSRPHDHRREVLPLRPVIEEALQLVRATLPAMVDIRAEYAADAPAVAIDSNEMHQIMVNLATNSAHAIGPGKGRIEVKLERADVSDFAASISPDLRPGRYARLSVSDDGCGMDRETLECVFDPFFTTKPLGVGTGLGLSVVHGILKSSGGAVTVYSQPGRGTTFRLYFPAAELPVEASRDAGAETARRRDEHVLYIDDDESLVALLQRLLERLGYRVTGYTDAEQALRDFRSRPTDFDVVVTDLSMPGTSGFEVAKQILDVRRDLPILMTSGYVRPEDQEAALRIGIRSVILKPDTIDDLATALDRLFAGGTERQRDEPD